MAKDPNFGAYSGEERKEMSDYLGRSAPRKSSPKSSGYQSDRAQRIMRKSIRLANPRISNR